MSETLQADRLLILARHSLTPANRAKYEGSAESRVQGLSVDMPVADPEGVLQSHALGIALSKFMLQYRIQIVEVHASNAARNTATRDLALEHVPGLTTVAPSQELWEHRKGNLEGMLRSEAYPDDETRLAAATDWDFRHGTRKTGGETPREAGERWVRWFHRLTEQPNFQPRTSPAAATPAVLVFGHNLITACGITLLNHDGQSPLPPVSDRAFKVANATGLLLAEQNGQWSALPERLAPTATEFEEAQAYVAER